MRADRKAHGGTEAWPGGTRYNKRTGDIIGPDGSIEGNLKGKDSTLQRSQQAARPVRQAAPTATPRPIDPENSLGKLQEYNRQQAAKDKQ